MPSRPTIENDPKSPKSCKKRTLEGYRVDIVRIIA